MSPLEFLRRSLICGALVGAGFGTVIQSAGCSAVAEEWTDLRGTATITAELIGIWNDNVILKRDNGKQISVKLSNLNADSRLRAQDLQEQIKLQIDARVSELSRVATEDAAPASPAPEALPDAPAYEPPANGKDLATTIDQTLAQIKNGHIRAVFDTMPASHQQRADELFKLALGKVDDNQWELARSTLYQALELVLTKDRWLFSHPAMANIDETTRANLISVGTWYRQWATPENASLNDLRAKPLAETIASLDQSLAPQLYQFFTDNSLMTVMMSSLTSVETTEQGQTLLKVGETAPIPMVQVEGCWVQGTQPETALAQWDQFKQSLQAIPDRSLRYSAELEDILRTLKLSLIELEAAPNRKEFHRLLDETMLQLRPSIEAWAGIKPTAAGYDSSNSYTNPASDPRLSDPRLSDPSFNPEMNDRRGDGRFPDSRVPSP